MEKKSFFRSTAFYIGTGVIIAGVITYLIIKDSKGDSDACFTVSRDRLEEMLGEGFNEPGRDNYAESLVFFYDKEKEQLGILPSRNIDGDCQQLKEKAIFIDASGSDCDVSEIDSTMYAFEPSDIDPSTGRLFDFTDMELERSSDTRFTFKMSYTGSSKITYTVPCPPYCPKPVDK